MFNNGSLSLNTNAYIVISTAATALVGTMVFYRHAKKDSKKEPVKKTWDKRIIHQHGSIKNMWPNVLYSLEAHGCSLGPPVRNMHIYCVPDGTHRLVIYNGVTIDDATLHEIEALGTPSILVVPNSMHREDAAIWKDKFPNMIVVCPLCCKERVSEEVVVDMTMEEWIAKDEWSQYVTAKVIDGWCEFELLLEVQLQPVIERKEDDKIAVLVCDLLFTLIKNPNFSFKDRCIDWFFDSSIVVPTDPTSIIVPAVSRIARLFVIKDWKKAEQWYRNYAKECGKKVAVLLVGHGLPVTQVDPTEGCTKALEGVADQLIKPRW